MWLRLKRERTLGAGLSLGKHMLTQDSGSALSGTTEQETLNLKLPNPLNPEILLLKLYLTGKQVRSTRMLAVVFFVTGEKLELIHSL